MADLTGLDVGDLAPAERPAAVGVLARGMRDNPIHIAALGPDPERRERLLRRLFERLFTVMTQQQPIAARLDGRLVGVSGLTPPGTCQPTVAQSLRQLPTLVSLGPATIGRSARWLAAWARRDLAEPHVHYGPFAVEPELQGQGIGSRILAEHCARLDAAAVTGYLETDKAVNVPLYERFGYAVLEEAVVLGVPNWFMRRGAA